MENQNLLDISARGVLQGRSRNHPVGWRIEIIAGIIFGFLGSVHCLGMCGPIALALPIGTHTWWVFVAGRLAYNLGRVVTYAALGAAAGFLGGRVFLPSIQQYVSIAAGTLILLGVLVPKNLIRPLLSTSRADILASKLRLAMVRLLNARTFRMLFALGVVNGFLPCGFVYLALAAALTTGGVVAGMLFMSGFGFGTIPAMLGIALFPKLISSDARQAVARYLPGLTVLVGILLIVRGLNLGIPYVSPRLAQPVVQHEECH